MLRSRGMQRVKGLFLRARSYGTDRTGPWVEVTIRGLRWRLCMTRYLDREIAQRGVFEPSTTHLVQTLLKPGMRVLDIGANIGYFSLICAQQVGPSGRVWAFEPVSEYRERLAWHIAANKFEGRVCVVNYGLSDETKSVPIALGDSSATLHWALHSQPHYMETIQVRPLDQVWQELGCNNINFVKVDIDGHEPFFLRGAQVFFRHYRPVMVLEFSQLNLEKAGENALHLKRMTEEMGYTLYSEQTLRPLTDKARFFLECASKDQSANVWAVPRTAVTADTRLDRLLRII